ncbi:MAG TPA: hypothetical protein VF800_12070 [Telluria sp.]|jgi:hypothetical protein
MLQITSPPPRRIGALLLCLAMAVGLSVMMQHNAGKASPAPLAGWIVSVIMLLACLCVIGRNLFFSESLSVARGAIVSVADADRPTYGTMAWSMSWWGFRGQRLLIETTEGGIPFGIGLSERQAADIIVRLEAFCGRQLAAADAPRRA